jgi:hypothetical protein
MMNVGSTRLEFDCDRVVVRGYVAHDGGLDRHVSTGAIPAKDPTARALVG